MRSTVTWLLPVSLLMALALSACNTGLGQARGDAKALKIGIVLTSNDPETVFNVFRLANFSADNGDSVSIFLLGKGVELDQIKDAKFDVQGNARAFLAKGGKIMACGTCLKLRNSNGSDLCPISTLKDLHALVQNSERVLTF